MRKPPITYIIMPFKQSIHTLSYSHMFIYVFLSHADVQDIVCNLAQRISQCILFSIRFFIIALFVFMFSIQFYIFLNTLRCPLSIKNGTRQICELPNYPNFLLYEFKPCGGQSVVRIIGVSTVSLVTVSALHESLPRNVITFASD